MLGRGRCWVESAGTDEYVVGDNGGDDGDDGADNYDDDES